MLFANIEMFIAINKFVSDLFIAINKFYKLFLFMVFVGETTYGRTKWLQYALCPAKRLTAGENGCNTLFVRRKWAFTGQSDV